MTNVYATRIASESATMKNRIKFINNLVSAYIFVVFMAESSILRMYATFLPDFAKPFNAK